MVKGKKIRFLFSWYHSLMDAAAAAVISVVSDSL